MYLSTRIYHRRMNHRHIYRHTYIYIYLYIIDTYVYIYIYIHTHPFENVASLMDHSDPIPWVNSASVRHITHNFVKFMVRANIMQGTIQPNFPTSWAHRYCCPNITWTAHDFSPSKSTPFILAQKGNIYACMIIYM